MNVIYARAIFVSDLHLGVPESNVGDLINLLQNVRAEVVYLVGDMIDIREIRARGDARCADLANIFALLKLLRGARLHYICGNHDPEPLVEAAALDGLATISNERVHITRRGERILVIHGHQVDSHIGTHAEVLVDVIALIYKLALRLQLKLNRLRNILGRPGKLRWVEEQRYRISGWRRRVTRYEARIRKYALGKTFRSVICGHIHVPAILRDGEFSYYNTGDWVENRTILFEDDAGDICQLRYDSCSGTFRISTA
ncbi:UDP-2,3-diacylglucosamine diphosphatase [Agrobacterium fabrum]|uniref:UDP-2,3-diacylglucosamine diphosphatase n=1 Tax=Agrobacterium fabrum TaxID=1176649 RepID=UPI003B9DF0D9